MAGQQLAAALRVAKRLVPHGVWNVAGGVQTYLPGGRRHWASTGGTDDAAYCYEVFLKHLTLSCEAGMPGLPPSVAEIGPGDSIGIGLAALVAGADRYSALDVVPYLLDGRNLRLLRELSLFFRERRPDLACGWPRYDHLLDDRCFPSAILTEALLERSLDPARLDRIEAVLRGRAGRGPIRVRYHCPWTSRAALEPESVDWVYSQSVMEHVDDLAGAYESMSRWLRPGGFVSHQVDLRSHGLYDEWNGHWAVPRWQWRVIRGRRHYLINRLPYTAHRRLVEKHFEIRTELLLERDDGIPDHRLRAPFDALDGRERRTAGYFVVAVKRSGSRGRGA